MRPIVSEPPSYREIAILTHGDNRRRESRLNAAGGSLRETRFVIQASLDNDVIRKLMEEVICEADLSEFEDDGPRPKVGALLVDVRGQIVLTAHRGELPDHRG